MAHTSVGLALSSRGFLACLWQGFPVYDLDLLALIAVRRVGVTNALKLDRSVQLGRLFAVKEHVVLTMCLNVVYYQTSRLPARLHTPLAFDVLRARRRSAACLLGLSGLLSPGLGCYQHDEHECQQVLVHGNAPFPSLTLPLCYRLRPRWHRAHVLEDRFFESWRPAVNPIALKNATFPDSAFSRQTVGAGSTSFVIRLPNRPARIFVGCWPICRAVFAT